LAGRRDRLGGAATRREGGRKDPRRLDRWAGRCRLPRRDPPRDRHGPGRGSRWALRAGTGGLRAPGPVFGERAPPRTAGQGAMTAAWLDRVGAEIPSADEPAMAAASAHLDRLTKP